jgi:hypothetical protein
MGILRRLLIIDDQRDFARLVGAVAERIGFTTRILHHTLDFEYVMHNWDPEYLEKIKYPGRLLMTGDVKLNTLEDAARIAGKNRPNVASVLTKSSSNNEIEAALKRLFDLESAA